MKYDLSEKLNSSDSKVNAKYRGEYEEKKVI